MAKVIGTPARYIQGNGVLGELYDFVEKLGTKDVFAVVVPFVMEAYGDLVKKSFEGKDRTLDINDFNGECSMNEVNRLLAELKNKNADVVVGIGGGKCLDTAKAVAFYAGLPCVICPTIASTDAPCSALAVVYTDSGEFDRYLFLPRNPDAVLVDSGVVVNAPARMLVSGIGDALATYFEARSCVDSNATNMLGGKATNAAFALSERCYEILMSDGYKAKLACELNQNSQAVENIIEANTYMSGVGFESCGLAAAHAIHNGLTVLPETHHATHGEKVAFGTIVHLVLENADMEEIDEVIEFCKQLGLPTTLKELGVTDPTPEKLMEVAKSACAEGDTMGNMPMPIEPSDVVSAILVADKLGTEF